MELLREGGAAGHMSHLTDNPSLTLGEIKEVISTAAQGKLERVSEKLDGMNMVFTYDREGTGLRIARTGSDIGKGGMDALTLKKKFVDRPQLQKAFATGFSVLEQALGSLPIKVLNRVFGKGKRWYSLELIYADMPNTINYDSDNIVFHGSPVFEIQRNGRVDTVDDQPAVNLLQKNIDRMQNAIAERNWKIRGPVLLRLKKLSNGSAASQALNRIDDAMQEAGVGESSTVAEYVYGMAQTYVSRMKLPDDVAKALAGRLAGIVGSPSVVQIRKMIDPAYHSVITNAVKNVDELQKQFIFPIEDAIHDFTIEVLKGLHSSLIADNEAEVKRLKVKVASAIKAIQAKNSKVGLDVLNREMKKLKDVENIGSPMEGIVFFFKGHAYKFTGAFAPANRILGLFTYGKGGVKFTESKRPKMMLLEGGHAFSDVQEVTLDEFNDAWDNIVAELEDLGLIKITPIGSTGKKLVSGDIDLAAEYNGTRDELFEFAKDVFGSDSVRKVGHNIITIRYPIHDKFVQVDVMLGDTGYIGWARRGTSSLPDHPDFSKFKGAMRNIIFAAVLQELSYEQFPEGQTELDRERFNIDFDKGLYRVKQTRRGAKGPTKSWKDLDREFITKNPDEIASTMFGDSYTAKDLGTLENVVDAIRTSPLTKNHAADILRRFIKGIIKMKDNNPRGFGSNPDETVQALKDLTGV